MKPREEGLISNNIKPDETRTPSRDMRLKLEYEQEGKPPH
jgi:hypothetical protein